MRHAGAGRSLPTTPRRQARCGISAGSSLILHTVSGRIGTRTSNRAMGADVHMAPLDQWRVRRLQPKRALGLSENGALGLSSPTSVVLV
jgi:hypothetical protein